MRQIMDLNLFGSPFYTPRSLLWNIRALGFLWWVACVLVNTRLAFAEWRVRAD
jgi:hypothetical protein